MRITILGTGALARYYAFRMRTLGPTLIGRMGPAYQVLGAYNESVVHPTVRDWADAPLPADVILLTVKWAAMELVVDWLRRIPGNPLIISFMNGLGQEEALSSVVRRDQLAIGLTTTACRRVDCPMPGVIVHHVGQESLPLLSHPAVTSLQDALDTIDFAWNWRPQEDMLSLRWHKLLANCVINPLSALSHHRNGELLTLPIWRLATPLITEALAVASALSVDLPDFSTAHSHIRALAKATGSNRSSMLQDVEATKITEIEAINGYIVAKGQALSIPTPTHQAITQLVAQMHPAKNATS